MRNLHLPSTLLVLLLAPALAGAGTLEQLTATADCNGWYSEVTVAFAPGSQDVLLVFHVQLADSTGAELDQYHFEQWLEIPATGSAIYPFNGTWPTPLTQNATVVVAADVYNARGDTFVLTGDELLIALTCTAGGGTPAEPCRHGSRWWLRHRAAWPVAALELGGATYDTARLERLLRAPHRGRVGHRLAHQLAVAKLNLANGVTNDIATMVEQADAWLTVNPLLAAGPHREPRGGDRREALRLIKDLWRWNHGDCRDGSQLIGDEEGTGKDGLTLDFGPVSQEFSADQGDYDATDKAVEETTSLGTLKAMYR